jgi:hypothetical protein
VATCVVGIVGLLPEINGISSLSARAIIQQVCLGIIYFILLFGMVFSIWRVLGIYRENRKLARSGRLGTVIKIKAEKERTRIDRFIDWKWHIHVSELAICIMIIVFSLLYLAKIGVVLW